MKKVNIGKITEFSNFNNGNDGITIYKKNKLNMKYYEFTRDGIYVWFDVPSMRNITYITKIYIDDQNTLKGFSCSCTYKNTINDVCKHIIASYIFFLNDFLLPCNIMLMVFVQIYVLHLQMLLILHCNISYYKILLF